ncbi:unnamed protein product [Hydatigera taeniaeformis]|uniref:Secreted protein n=1 Tax=Hydatigena taeniaeformis TaxID=6205 RepID=A0A0R3WSR2_HYDTA|nr:unnamed protein product [Hydatigera taeniaeformis]
MLTIRRCYFLTRKLFTLPTYTIRSTNCGCTHTHTYMAATLSHCPIFSAIRFYFSLLLGPFEPLPVCVCALNRTSGDCCCSDDLKSGEEKSGRDLQFLS